MSLLDEMDVDVVAYRPERAGEGVEGVLIAQDITTSEYTSDDIPVLTLKQDDGVFRGVRGYHSVLRNELEKASPEVGDLVAIVYEGKKPTKDGKRTYQSYKVRVQRQSAVNDDASERAPF